MAESSEDVDRTSIAGPRCGGGLEGIGARRGEGPLVGAVVPAALAVPSPVSRSQQHAPYLFQCRALDRVLGQESVDDGGKRSGVIRDRMGLGNHGIQCENRAAAME